MAKDAQFTFRQHLDTVLTVLEEAGATGVSLHLSQADEDQLCSEIISDLDAGQPAPLNGTQGIDATYKSYPRDVVAQPSYIAYIDPDTGSEGRMPIVTHVRFG